MYFHKAMYKWTSECTNEQSTNESHLFADLFYEVRDIVSESGIPWGPKQERR